ncbi:hypothetical protein P5624_01335 [Bacillus subtilis]|jgi:hypothetical protein|uniref:hypothetical protein n=1 Tax=Bacillus TaxID=1386 RepID=UPI0003F80210|nr:MULTISPECIES: hypothetical protein [Bacillus]MDH3082858.1 hypothetical protein [Bacillus subtilis]MEC0314438.1 hypothetical protein [Bacillus subtilis]MEC0363348.1 hypothetical protein [Bacillus subtilis]MEC0392084.1 hypothetical protein [Bacillus subtilis]MED3603484.1 hypothetical protein [Bacillus subtilis]
MKTGIKILYLFTTLLFVSSIIFGLIMKSSLIDNVNIKKDLREFDGYTVSLNYTPEYTNIYFDNNIKNLKELISKSDLVVVGTVGENRQNYNQALKSNFKVEKTIKSKSKDNLKNVVIYEPSNFSSGTYNVESGYNVMEPNKKYLLFLKHLKIPSGYKYKNNEALTYMPVSSFYGKYTVNENKEHTKLIDINTIETKTYHNIKEYEILTDDKNILQRLNDLKAEISKEKFQSKN